MKEARARLILNLSERPIPPYLLSQFLPVQYELIREGRLTPEPEALIEHKIQCVMDRYYQNMLRGAGERPGR